MYLQRLFSTFADGWPGTGLLLQRLLTGTVLVYHAVICVSATTTECAAVVPQIFGAVVGTCLLVGLWTPVAGTLVAIAGGWLLWANAADAWSSIMVTVFGATLAMIGPGAWSIDARLFGRRRIQASEL